MVMSKGGFRIKRVACVGAGTIGTSWTTIFAGKGYEVALEDNHSSALKLAEKRIDSNFRELTSSRLLSKSEATDARSRIVYTTDLREAVSEADFIQESVPESLPLKKRMFAKISMIAPQHAVMASSTGGFLMSEIQSASSRPSKCVVIHPCQFPVHLTKLVEIVPGKATSQSTVLIACNIIRKIGKNPIVLKKEVSDYISNRLQFTLLREALDMVGRGLVSAEDVDFTLCEVARTTYCVGLGPFLSMHLRGGSHALGGIEAAVRYYGKILPDTWRSLAKWTRIPRPVIVGVQESVRELVSKRRIDERQFDHQISRSLLQIARSVWAN
jgi:carnitine 3-dehydrogenase